MGRTLPPLPEHVRATIEANERRAMPIASRGSWRTNATAWRESLTDVDAKAARRSTRSELRARVAERKLANLVASVDALLVTSREQTSAEPLEVLAQLRIGLALAAHKAQAPAATGRRAKPLVARGPAATGLLVGQAVTIDGPQKPAIVVAIGTDQALVWFDDGSYKGLCQWWGFEWLIAQDPGGS